MVAARRAVLGVGSVLRAVRVRHDDDRCRSSGAARACGSGRPARICSRRSSASSPRSRRRYGGYVVHLGIVLVFLGFAGGGFEREEQVHAQAGPAGRRRRRTPCGSRRSASPTTAQKQMVTAQVETFTERQAARARCIRRGGSSAAARTSRRPKSRCGAAFADDLYLVLAGYDVDDAVGDARRSRSIRSSTGSGSASASWSIGTIIALLPERAFAFATSRRCRRARPRRR